MTQSTPYFETPEHKDELLAHLRLGRMPLKFAYAGSAARTHDALAQTEGYKAAVVDVEPEYAALKAVMQLYTLNKYQLFEIGPGNGDHSKALLTRLVHSDLKIPEAYLGLDFSSELLEIAKPKLTSVLQSAPQFEVGDIEAARTCRVDSWRAEAPLVALFLGNTLGNVAEPRQVLANIRQSLRTGDILLLGVSTYDKSASSESVVEPYQSEAFRTALLEPLRAIGVDTHRCILSISLDGRNVRGTVTFEGDPNVVGLANLPSGPIHCFQSTRFENQEVASLLESTGWCPLLSHQKMMNANYSAIPSVGV